jgi:hypothetical protein
MEIDRKRVARDFRQAVNMTADEIEAWLRTKASRSVGSRPDGGESVGHASGRRIAAILRKDPWSLGDQDYAHMRKVVGFVRRHLAQEPANVVTSRWRYSLMNWGHDPIKQARAVQERRSRAGVDPGEPASEKGHP